MPHADPRRRLRDRAPRRGADRLRRCPRARSRHGSTASSATSRSSPPPTRRSRRSRRRTDDGLHVLRHSTAHVLAQAVCDLYPGTKYAIGPAIDDGFYYDFELPEPLVADDLAAIDARMRADREAEPAVRARGGLARRRARAAGRPAVQGGDHRRASDDDDGREGVGGGDTVTPLPQRRLGRPVPGSARAVHRRLGAFKLTNVAGAYWRGDEKNPQLTRIYGTAWATKDDLDAYLHRLEEAERRDHRKLGRRARPVLVPRRARVGARGVPSARAASDPAGCWRTTRGVVTRRPATSSCTRRTSRSAELFETSGHLEWFADGMFPPMELDGGTEYYLKPMNCPMHVLIYKPHARATASCRCGCSSSGRSIATRSPA